MNRRREKREPRRTRDLIGTVLADLGLEGAAAALRIAERWEAIVGPEVARHCQPTALRGAVLEVSVDSSVWCQQLQLRIREILAALRRELGAEAPADLWLRVGYDPVPARPPESLVSQDPAHRGDEAGPAGRRCDFCGEVVPRVQRVALDQDYDRLQTPHRELYACGPCSERKERSRLGLEPG